MATDEDQARLAGLRERAAAAGAGDGLDDYADGQFDEDGGRNGIVPALVLSESEVKNLFTMLAKE